VSMAAVGVSVVCVVVGMVVLVLESTTNDHSRIFGHDSPDLRVGGASTPLGFRPVSSQPVRGHDVPGTITSNAS